MKQRLESAKLLSITIDGKSGVCTPTFAKIKLNALEDPEAISNGVYGFWKRKGLWGTQDAFQQHGAMLDVPLSTCRLAYFGSASSIHVHAAVRMSM
jgi:hypothetical protein